MTDRRLTEVATIFARLLEQLAATPKAEPDPLLIGPARLAKLLDITKGRAAFQMRAGLFGPIVFIGREPRVRMRGVEMWLEEQDGREGEGDGRTGDPEPTAAYRRGERARADSGARPSAATAGNRSHGASRIIAIAPRSTRPTAL